jgi:hypothetical protein
MIAYQLNATIDFLMPVIEEQRIMCVELDSSLILWLSAGVVKVARLEIVIVLFLEVRHVSSRGRL